MYTPKPNQILGDEAQLHLQCKTMDKTLKLSVLLWFASCLDSPLTYDVLLVEQKFCLSPQLSDHPNPTHLLLGILGQHEGFWWSILPFSREIIFQKKSGVIGVIGV
jgi:hypothetical protein